MDASVLGKDRPWSASIYAKNGETTAIPAGSLLCLNPTDAGSVKLLSTQTSAAIATSLLAGVAARGAAPGDPLQVIVRGYVKNALFVVRTRTASGDSWASVAARGAGDLLGMDSSNNAFAYSAAAAASNYLPWAVLAEAKASVAGAASSYKPGLLVDYGFVPVLLRAL